MIKYLIIRCSVGHKDGKLFHRQDIAKHVGDDKLQKLINFRDGVNKIWHHTGTPPVHNENIFFLKP